MSDKIEKSLRANLHQFSVVRQKLEVSCVARETLHLLMICPLPFHLQSLTRMLADKYCLFCEQEKVWGCSIGDLQAARSEATEACALAASIQKAYNGLAEAARRDMESVALACHECTKAVSHLHILERGKEVAKAPSR